jgi:hypothetical protein
LTATSCSGRKCAVAFHRHRLLLVLVLGCVLGSQTEFATAQSQPDPGGTPQTALGPIAPEQRYMGAIEEPGDLDTFRFDTPQLATSIQFSVSHTNDRCEIWTTLTDAFGTTSELTFVPRTDSMILPQITLGGGTLYVTVSAGSLRDCSGASYSLIVSLADFPQTVEGASAVLMCSAACSKARGLSVERRQQIKRVKKSRGASRRRALRRLKRVTRGFSAAKAEMNRWCS